jgi:ubiquinone/menaquinone biosynthesis C-methylase UbiE
MMGGAACVAAKDIEMPRAKNAEDIAEAYSSEPWWYDARGFLILTFAYRSTLGSQLRLFGPNFGPQHLELACGTGTLLDLVLRWRRWKSLPLVQITGVDYAEKMLIGAQRRFAGREGMEFLRGDAAALEFSDEFFDTINIANAVHCLPDPDASLREMLRVLKRGGTLAANVLLFPRGSAPLRSIAERINAWGIRKGILVTPYEEADIVNRIERAGFVIKRRHVAGNCLEVLAERPRASVVSPAPA